MDRGKRYYGKETLTQVSVVGLLCSSGIVGLSFLPG